MRSESEEKGRKEKSLSHHYANPFRVKRHLNKTRKISEREINMDSKDALVVFEGTKIRRTWHDDQWYFSVVDVVQVLTDSPTPRQYWGKIKDREFQQIELSPIWVQLKLPSADGKSYKTDCANTESMFRIIQSIPSRKAEPFKRWLAKVGYERIQEIENPELAQDRVKEYYERCAFYYHHLLR